MSLTISPNLANHSQSMACKSRSQAFTAKPCNCGDAACSEAPKKKTSFFQKMKNGFANFQKFFINVGCFTGGLVKGLFCGGLTFGAVLGGNALYRAVTLGSMVKEGTKEIAKVSKLGKAAAVVAGSGVLVYKMIKAKLNANEKTSKVDHRWKTGHNEG